MDIRSRAHPAMSWPRGKANVQPNAGAEMDAVQDGGQVCAGGLRWQKISSRWR